MKYPEILKKLTTERNHTACSLARLINVPESTVRGWFKGQSIIPHKQIGAVREALKLDLSDYSRLLSDVHHDVIENYWRMK